LTQYSHSKLSTFENCPRQYEYRYVLKVKCDREGIEAFTGKRVHEILERLYHHVGRHGRPPSLRQVLERFYKDWQLRWSDSIEIVRDDLTAEDYSERGRRCLENYYRAHYPFDREETVALECKIDLKLDSDGRYRARGIIDRLVRTAPGCYEVHDYKTGASLPPRARLESDRQLALYQIGVEQRYDDAESVDLVWHYLLFNKTLRSRRTPDQLQCLREETIGLIDTIQSASTYPSRPGPLCRWCDYKDICPDAAVRPDEPASGPLPPAPPPELEADRTALGPGAAPLPPGFAGEAQPALARDSRPAFAPEDRPPFAPPQAPLQLDLFS
jgi:putative RecB family exonuclease